MGIFRWVKVRKRPNKKLLRLGLQKHKQSAEILVNSKLKYWNQFYNFTYNRVCIRAQTTRWGSCSSKGNLNFNYKISLLPEHIADYIIVHELCHLKQFNHSADFWNLVAQTIPDYLERRSQLHNLSSSITADYNLR